MAINIIPLILVILSKNVLLMIFKALERGDKNPVGASSEKLPG